MASHDDRPDAPDASDAPASAGASSELTSHDAVAPEPDDAPSDAADGEPAASAAQGEPPADDDGAPESAVNADDDGAPEPAVNAGKDEPSVKADDGAPDSSADAGKDEASKSPVNTDDGAPEPSADTDEASEPPGPPRSHRFAMVAVVAGILLALDLVTKQWAWDNLRHGGSRVLVEGWAYLEFGFNTGSAFSLLRDASWSRMLFIGITVLALLYMGHLARTLPTRFGSAFVAIAMVASGALGNLHDRFFRVREVEGEMRHGVVDFIRIFYWEGKPWPTFNVADVALVAGVLLLLVFLLRHGDVLDAPAASSTDAS